MAKYNYSAGFDMRGFSMAYTKEGVKQMLLTQFGGAEALAKSVGMGEGGSRAAQHEAAVQFWELALTLPEDVQFSRAFARSEIVRHQTALEKLRPSISTVAHAIAV